MGAPGALGPGSPLGVLKVAPAGWSGWLVTTQRPSPLRTAGVRRGGPGTSGTEPSGSLVSQVRRVTACALGAHRAKEGRPPVKVTPSSARVAASA